MARKKYPKRGVSRTFKRFPNPRYAVHSPHNYTESFIFKFARRNRRNPTKAEIEIDTILQSLNKGVLQRRYCSQYTFNGKWILDIFFPENRLAIEVDGSIHLATEQRKRDRAKEADCKEFDITLIRVTNKEVFGNRQILIEKLRDGWRQALLRENRIIGRPYIP